MKNRTVQLIQTAKGTDDRLSPKRQSFLPSENGDQLPCVELHADRLFQEIEGFGGAFTEACAHTLQGMSPEKREEIINAYFHPENGLGYSLCRTHINSCDFSLGNYSYDEVEGDTDLAHFTIERDRELLIPLIKAARNIEGASFKVLASPWSPPAWMKTTGEMNHGGKLKPECRDAWARYFCKYIDAYADEGIPIWGVTVQNEPEAVQKWDSCIYTAEEEGDFVKSHLGPRFDEAGLQRVKIIIWDHNKDRIYERATKTLSDPRAAKYIWGIGFHWYSGGDFENLARTHGAFPDKKLIFTEGCQEHGVKLGSWKLGERYGRAIIGDLNNWTVGWIDWNMALNEQGGPNHAGNFCDAPVIADTPTDTIYYQSAFYYLGHFSKYIRPGARRIGCVSASRHLEVVAFRNTDGETAVVVMNRTNDEIPFVLKEGGFSCKTASPARSIQTYIISAS